MNKKLVFSALVLFLAGMFSAYWFSKKDNHETSLFGHLGGNFTVQSVEGEVELKDFKGKVVLLYMGFTHCPDVCPNTLSLVSRVWKVLDSKVKQDIVPIFVSVDHVRDTPKSVQDYTQFFFKELRGFSGTKKMIDDLTKKYAAFYKIVPMPESEMKFTVDHTSKLYLIGRDGRLIDIISDQEDVTKLAQKLETATR